MMMIHHAKPLFAWDCLEDSPSLQIIKNLLAALPDGKLLNSLRAARGKVSVTVREGATFSARCVPDRNRWGSAKWHPLGWLGSRMDRL